MAKRRQKWQPLLVPLWALPRLQPQQAPLRRSLAVLSAKGLVWRLAFRRASVGKTSLRRPLAARSAARSHREEFWATTEPLDSVGQLAKSAQRLWMASR